MESTAGPVRGLIEALSRLPSIGKKSAARLAYHILRLPAGEAEALSRAIREAKEKVRECRACFNYAEQELCPVCASADRVRTQICVVEKPSDIPVIEKSGVYKGLYHVLGGALSPVDGVTPERLRVGELLNRVDGPGYEIILSVSTGTEGDHTVSYLAGLLKEKGARVTRMARGLPVGVELEYMDEITLLKALEGRVEA
jgi:recombination protein RecR